MRRHDPFNSKDKKRVVRALRKRDGDYCFCDEVIDFSLTETDPNNKKASSIDHIIPRSEGGGNELSNLRLAHRICNERREHREDKIRDRVVIKVGKHTIDPVLELFQSYQPTGETSDDAATYSVHGSDRHYV